MTFFNGTSGLNCQRVMSKHKAEGKYTQLTKVLRNLSFYLLPPKADWLMWPLLLSLSSRSCKSLLKSSRKGEKPTLR